MTTLPTTHYMNPDMYHYSYLGFFHFLVKDAIIFLGRQRNIWLAGKEIDKTSAKGSKEIGGWGERNR